MKRKRNLFFLTEKLMNEPLIFHLFNLLKSFKRSAKNQKSNRSLNKLTNENLDNQSVSLPKNKELEQEKRKTTIERN